MSIIDNIFIILAILVGVGGVILFGCLWYFWPIQQELLEEERVEEARDFINEITKIEELRQEIMKEVLYAPRQPESKTIDYYQAQLQACQEQLLEFQQINLDN